MEVVILEQFCPTKPKNVWMHPSRSEFLAETTRALLRFCQGFSSFCYAELAIASQSETGERQNLIELPPTFVIKLRVVNIANGVHRGMDECHNVVSALVAALTLLQGFKESLPLGITWEWVFYPTVPQDLTNLASGQAGFRVTKDVTDGPQIGFVE